MNPISDEDLVLYHYRDGLDAAALAGIAAALDASDALRARYVPIIRGVLPGVKAATFFQIERRVSMMIDQRIAAQLPLLQFQNPVAQ